MIIKLYMTRILLIPKLERSFKDVQYKISFASFLSLHRNKQKHKTTSISYGIEQKQIQKKILSPFFRKPLRKSYPLLCRVCLCR